MFNIVLEVGQQPFQRREHIRRFHIAVVPVIALAALVVIPDATFSWRSVEEPVLVSMQARRYGLRQRPDHHLDDRSVVADFLDLDEGAGAYSYCILAIYCQDAIPCAPRSGTGPRA